MRQQGKRISGDPVLVDNYTSDWMSIRLHPTNYYRHQDEIIESLNTSKGLYTEIDMGQYVLIRFSEKDDVTNFHRRHHSHT